MSTSWTFIAGAVFALAAGTSALLAPRLIALHRRLGWVDRPDARKDQTHAVPYAGGLIVFVGFAAPMVLGAVALVLHRGGIDVLPESVAVHVPGLLERLPIVGAITIGAVIMMVMGGLDDRRPLPALPRFALQVAVATIVAVMGLRVTLFIESELIQIVLTAMWITFITNAFNFIDNMDGLLVGCSLATATTMGSLAAWDGQLFVALYAVALAGPLLVVLVYNRPPARLYLGDSGSMFLGFLFASLTIAASYRPRDLDVAGVFEPWLASVVTSVAFPFVFPFVVPLLLLFMPVVDGAFVITTRMLRGVSPTTAGTDHLSHRAARAGFGKRGAVALIVGVAGLADAVALLLYAPRTGHLVSGVFVAAVAGSLLVIAFRQRRRNRRTAPSDAPQA